MAGRRGLVLRDHCPRRVPGSGQRTGAVRPADHHRFWNGVDRAARRQRQAGAARRQDLGGNHQQEGRPARSPGETHLLRRPVEPVDRAGHLHQAARRRQSRSRDRPLCHRHDRARDAGGDAEGQGVHRIVRARREQRIQLSEIFRHDPVRPGDQAVVHERVFRRRRAAEPQAADGRAGRGRSGILAQCL